MIVSQIDRTLPLEFSYYFSRELSSLEVLISQGDTLADVILPIEQAILRLFEVEVAVIFQSQPRSESLTLLYSTSRRIGSLTVPAVDSTPAGWVTANKTTLQIDDFRDPDHLAIVAPEIERGISDMMFGDIVISDCLLTPIMHENHVLGVIQLMNRKSNRSFTMAHHRALERIAELIGERFHKELCGSKSPFEGLVERGLISDQLLSEMSVRAHRADVPLTLVFRDRLNIPDAEIGQALSEFYQVPWLQYSPEFEPISDIVDVMGAEFLGKQGWVPLHSSTGECIVLAANPDERESILSLLQLSSTEIFDVWVGLHQDIMRYLGIESRLPTELAEAGAALNQLVGRMTEVDPKEATSTELSTEIPADNESIIIPVVNCIIANAVNTQASDIHIQPRPGRRGAKVRMRVDGVLTDGIDIPASHFNAVVNRIKIMGGMDIAEHRRPQDGKLVTNLCGQTHELRVATLPTVNGETIILRILKNNNVFDFDRLNFLGHNASKIKNSINEPHGLILVAGATGSGKTTTIHGLINLLNTPGKNIVTVEDPVEISQFGLQQVQVNPRLGITFASAARAFMRADPDIIFIGEIRDGEAAKVALEASLTGHLVFATLHTNSAPETLARLLLMGLDPLNLADSLVAVVGQRLVRCICPDCRRSYAASELEIEKLARFLPESEMERIQVEGLQLHQGIGCEACNGTGYRGRVAIHEVMTCDQEMKDLIARAASSHEIRDLAHDQGMYDLSQDCAMKVLDGQIHIQELRDADEQ